MSHIYYILSVLNKISGTKPKEKEKMAYEKLQSIWRRRGLTEPEIQQKLQQKLKQFESSPNNYREQSQSQNKGGRPQVYSEGTISLGLRLERSNYFYLKNKGSINKQINKLVKEVKEND